jgi:NAD(P)-dependent dehydrogenase (short-subunit alcohol dehydrogenase family)
LNTRDPGRLAALVTGSSTGIGRATAVELARSGYDVVVHGLEQADIDDTVALVQAEGGRAIGVGGDIREPETATALVDAAVTGLGRLDAVVNNAGAGMTRPFTDIDDDDWTSILQMHLVSSTRILRLAHVQLRANRGAVVNTSSVAALVGLDRRTGYGAAKAAVDGLTRQLAGEWAVDGIRVNAVAPGTIITPLVERNFAKGLLDPAKVLERTPLGRFGDAREIATVTRFLLSDDASYITGQTIPVDGGWTIWGGWK